MALIISGTAANTAMSIPIKCVIALPGSFTCFLIVSDIRIPSWNIDILICNGENAKNIIKSAEKCGMNKENIYYFEEKKQVQEFVESNWEKGDVILFKASNGMKFFDIVSNLEKA